METIDTPTVRDKQKLNINHPGYYGKLPQRGDFIRAAISSQFANVWDDWLSEGLDFSKQALGDSWLQRYLHAPVWHFYLSQGVIGDNANIGIWFPSMDKVGRYFPFTLCCPIDEAPRGWIHNKEVDHFMSRLKRIGMVALDEACAVEDVDEAIEELQWPLRDLQPFRGNKAKLHEQISSDNSLEGLSNMLFDVVRSDHPRISFWWTQHSNGETTHKVYDGMPDKKDFLNFI